MSTTNTTPARVRGIARHLASMSDDALALHIADAVAEVGRFNVRGQYRERLQRYLAAHLATIDRRRPDSQAVSDLRTSYRAAQGDGLAGTEYGQEYQRLLRQATGAYLRVM